MGSHRVQFYATKKDLEQILEVVDTKAPLLKYALQSAMSPQKVSTFKSLRAFPDLGNANSGNFYVLFDDCPVTLVSQDRNDGVVTNSEIGKQNHLYFKPGGILTEGVLVMSEVNVLSNDPEILKLFELFRREIKRQSKHIASAAVCSEAEILLDKGWQLTPIANAIIKSGLRRRSATELKLDDFIAEICAGLVDGSIESIEIITVLAREFTFDALSAQDLEKCANAKLAVSEPSVKPWFEKLLKSLRNLDLRLADGNVRPPDVSWGVIFHSAKWTKKIYLNTLGTRGIIEGQSVSCDRRLLRVVKSIS